MKIFLLTLWSDNHPDSWCLGNMNALQSSALASHGLHTVAHDPKDADIILFVDCGPLPLGLSVLLHPFFRQYRSKCFVYDDRFPSSSWFRGLFVSLESGQYNPLFHRGASYFRSSTESGWCRPSCYGKEQYLFSFCGAIETHPLRLELLKLVSDQSFIVDVPRSVTQTAFVNGDKDTIERLHRNFRYICQQSLFVLCPRGLSASSQRLYEVMRMGRVPVVISDGWVPPYGPQWEQFVVRVREDQIDAIPSILEELRPAASEMGGKARKAWDDFFALESLFQNTVEACLDILNDNRNRAFCLRSFLLKLISKEGIKSLTRYSLKSLL